MQPPNKSVIATDKGVFFLDCSKPVTIINSSDILLLPCDSGNFVRDFCEHYNVQYTYNIEDKPTVFLVFVIRSDFREIDSDSYQSCDYSRLKGKTVITFDNLLKFFDNKPEITTERFVDLLFSDLQPRLIIAQISPIKNTIEFYFMLFLVDSSFLKSYCKMSDNGYRNLDDVFILKSFYRYNNKSGFYHALQMLKDTYNETVICIKKYRRE